MHNCDTIILFHTSALKYARDKIIIQNNFMAVVLGMSIFIKGGRSEKFESNYLQKNMKCEDKGRLIARSLLFAQTEPLTWWS